MRIIQSLFVLLALISFNLYSQQDNRITIGERLKINSKILNEEREIFINLPAGYNSESSYPVLYLLDGETHFQYTAGMINFMAVNGRAPQMILVGIPNTNRGRDLTPSSSAEVPNSGGGGKFLEFIKDELVPYIENKYSTENYRILFGHSAGGNFAVYSLLTYPELFNAYIAGSPYVVFDNNYVLKLAKEKRSDSFKTSKFFYMTIGNEPDYFAGLDELTGIFTSNFTKNFEWKYFRMPNENHGTIPLKTIYEGLEAIFSEWRLPDNFAQTGDLIKLKDHFQNLSNKFGYSIKAAEGVVNILGYQVMGLGKIDEALNIFEYNIELYPGSANVFDSYGECLEQAGKPELAKKNYEIAVKIGKEKNDPNTGIYEQHLANIQKKITN